MRCNLNYFPSSHVNSQFFTCFFVVPLSLVRSVFISSLLSTQPSDSVQDNPVPPSVIVTTLSENGDTVVLTTDSLPKHIASSAEVSASPPKVRDCSLTDDMVTESYIEKADTDVLLHDQQLECISEEEISTTVQDGKTILSK